MCTVESFPPTYHPEVQMMSIIRSYLDRRRLRRLQHEKYEIERRLAYFESRMLDDVQLANVAKERQHLQQVNEQLELYSEGPVRLKRVP